MSSSPAKVVVHLGLPKTGTTCLQNHVFANHTGIGFLGKDKKKDDEAAVQLATTIRGRAGSVSAEACREAIAPRLATIRERNLIPLWSIEALSGGDLETRRRNLQLVRTVFGECRAFIFLREPKSLVISWYFQKLRGYNLRRRVPPFWAPELGAPPIYYTIEHWLEKKWESPELRLNGDLRYAETIQLYADQFGLNNVQVFLFEELQENPVAVLHRLADFIGVDGDEMTKLYPRGEVHGRWTAGHLLRLHEIRKSRLQRLLFHFFPKLRLRMLTPRGPLKQRNARLTAELP